MEASDEPIDPKYQEMMHALADTLHQFLQPNGFVLLMFDRHDPGRVNYVSNCDRGDVLKAMQEFIDRQPRAAQA